MIKRFKSVLLFAFAVAISLAPMLALESGRAFATSGNCYFAGTTGVRLGGGCGVAHTDGDYGTNDVLTGRNTSGGCTTGASRGCAITWNTSKADFITQIRNDYNGSGHDHTGAGFIIQTMLIGVGGSGHPFPSSADESEWEQLISDSGTTFTYENVNVTNTSWYDNGKNNDFFDSYSSPPRSRDVLTIKQNGRVVGRIEVDCGNMTAYQDNPFKWGPMSGKSVATDASGNVLSDGSSTGSIAAGRTIYWAHTVTDDGVSGDPAGTDPTPTITGDIIWGGNTPLNGTVETNNTYSRSFSNGDSIAPRNRSKATTNPGDIGNKYCQRINGDSTSSTDPSNFTSATACVLVVTPPKVTPHTSINPNPVGIGQTYTATATLSNSEGLTGNVTATWRTWLDNGDQTYGAGDSSVNGPTTNTLDVPSSPPDTTFGTFSGVADNSHPYVCTSIYNVTGHSGTIVTAADSTTCVQVAARPYFNVFGGDVAAGAGFNTAGFAGASIFGTNNDNGLPPNGNNYNGASAQLAALALGSVTSFTTSQSPNGGVGPAWTNSLTGLAVPPNPYTPSALGFANNPLTAVTYGGNFSPTGGWKVQDYYSTTPNGGGFPGLAGAAAGNYYSASRMTLNGATITADGRKIVLKVNGDVYINSNITYAPAGAVTDIPQFELIVSGNIYVDPGVTELDGFYVAQGNGTTTGRFVSCGTNVTTPWSPIYSAGPCNTPTLVVNGAVAAQKVILNRTYGDVNGGGVGIPQLPGETIRFSPLLWIPSATGGSGVNNWQSVTSLPPIL